MKLILDTQHIQAIPVPQAVTAQSVRKTEQHFHRVTLVQKLRCPWAHCPKQSVTADYLEAKLILEGRHPIWPTVPPKSLTKTLSLEQKINKFEKIIFCVDAFIKASKEQNGKPAVPLPKAMDRLRGCTREKPNLLYSFLPPNTLKSHF